MLYSSCCAYITAAAIPLSTLDISSGGYMSNFTFSSHERTKLKTWTFPM